MYINEGSAIYMALAANSSLISELGGTALYERLVHRKTADANPDVKAIIITGAGDAFHPALFLARGDAGLGQPRPVRPGPPHHRQPERRQHGPPVPVRHRAEFVVLQQQQAEAEDQEIHGVYKWLICRDFTPD